MHATAFLNTGLLTTITRWSASKVRASQCSIRKAKNSSHYHSLRVFLPRAEVEQVPPDSTRVPELEALEPDSGSVTIPGTFNLAGAFLFTGGALSYAGDGWLVLGLPISAIGILLVVQTFRIRFLFGPSRISVANRSKEGLDIIRGWQYEKITNWEVWWKPVPILAYFKETESYNGRGSVHFFPILCDGKQLIQQFRERTPHLEKSSYD